MGSIIQYKYSTYLLAALFVLSEIAAVLLIRNNYLMNHQGFVAKNTREFEIGLTATLRNFEGVAQSVLLTPWPNDTVAPVVKALRLFSDKGFRPDSTAATMLEGIYNQVRAMGFKGFSVTDANGLVLIRMHNPTYCSDTLVNMLPLLHKAALTGKPVTGFDVGGSTSGFCIVMAVEGASNSKKFVLLTIDNVALQQELKKIFPHEYVFLINKEQVLESTTYTQLSGYHFSDLSEDYFYERSDRDLNLPGMRQYIAQSEIVLFNKINKRKIEKELLARRAFGLNAETHNNRAYTGLFFPVVAPDGRIAAFIISYSSDSTLNDYYKDGLIIFLVTALLILIAFSFLLFSIHTFRRLSRQNIKLAESQRQLQELNTSKDKFFSIIAHDLRNPFHGLVGLAEVLTEDFDTMPVEKARKFHQMIYESSRQGYQLVNNLLEWTRMQTGRFTFKPEIISLNRIVGEVTNQHLGSLQAKNITLQVDFPPIYSVYADYQMTSAILRNLLSNAIKFSHPGGQVTLKGIRTSDFARITLTDSGVGMDQDTLSGLWRIELSHSTKGTAGEPGTGLGLILVKEFVERNHGTISVKSEPGKGSTFTVMLPLTKN